MVSIELALMPKGCVYIQVGICLAPLHKTEHIDRQNTDCQSSLSTFYPMFAISVCNYLFIEANHALFTSRSVCCFTYNVLLC